MKFKKLSVFIILVCLCSVTFAQEQVTIKKKEFKTDQKEGFKEAWKSIQEGNDFYEQGLGTFAIARDHFLFADQYNAFNPELNYLIGICFLYTDDKFKAIDYLLKAYELKPEVSYEVELLIGRAYHLVLEFDKAKEFYKRYKSSLPADEDYALLSEEIEKLIVECTHGKSFTQEPHRVIIQNLGENVNSVHDDYNPKFAYGDTSLFYTSRRPQEKKTKRNDIDNKYNEDIYIASRNEDGFHSGRLLGKPFNSKGNDAIVGVAPDGGSVFVYIGDEEKGDIQQAYFLDEKGKWKKPKSLAKYIGSDARETSAALSPDGRELYYVSSNPDISNGSKDIMVVKKNAKGKWDEPESVGALINSTYDEEGIFLSKDGLTMYFASKGHNSMGGFDIFKSEKVNNDWWATPENLGYPINTPDDEIFYITDTSGTYGYYSTIREGGYGGKDIYKVINLGSEKEVSTLTKDDLIAGNKYPERNPFITYPSVVEIDTSLMLIGRVRDTIGDVDTTIMAGMSFMDPENGEIVARAMTGTDGYFRAKLPQAKMYGIEINANGYLYFLDILDLSGLNPDEPAEQDFFLQRIEVGTKVVLDNIYFQTGKSVLTPDSYEALNQVARFLEKNESVTLEISGHTDNTGSLRINTNLSQARAKAVVDYIVGQGIPGSRLEYRGYADSQPVAGNDTPEGREMNRRVEFKVLSK